MARRREVAGSWRTRYSAGLTDRRGSGRNVFLAAAVTVVAIAPVFMISAEAVGVERSLRLTVADLGIAVAAFSGATALSTAVLGRLVQRLGLRRGLVAGMAMSTIAFGSIAVARSSIVLFGAMFLSGIVNGAVQPSANGLLAMNRSKRPAQAFGVKQASATAASLLAGLVVPIIALTLGWRWSFVAMCLPGIALAVLARSALQEPSTPPSSPVHVLPGSKVPIAVLAVAGAFGSASGNAFATFFVVYGVHSEHVGQSTVALLFALAGCCGVVGRVTSGRVIDHSGWSAISLAGWLVSCGVGGDLLLAFAPFGAIGSLALGGLVAVGLGWAWPGLIHYHVASRDPEEAARSTGVMLTGFAAGACFGPLLLGELARTSGFGTVWRVVAALNLCAGVILLTSALVFRTTRRSVVVRDPELSPTLSTG